MPFLPELWLRLTRDSHSNSVDKTPDGDYFLSSRHTDTIYKVSGKDGHIIWRLGGKMSDFGHGDWTFSRQHDIRLREQNATHTVLSILDNARGIDSQEPTYPESRGLLLALDEKAMTVSIIQQIDHPDGLGNYAPRRGNYQALPGGSIFMGWSERAIQSEHAPDGTLLMHARLSADWLGSYRSYKFNFTGHPTEKPAVFSIASMLDDGSFVTTIYVSWNGATEVAYWNLYKTTADDETRSLIATVQRSGFESVAEYTGLAKYVLLEGVDQNGDILGESAVTHTIQSTNITVADLASATSDQSLVKSRTVVFCLGVASGGVMALIIWALRHRGTLIAQVFGRYRKVTGDLSSKDSSRAERILPNGQSQGEPGGEAMPLRAKRKGSLDSLSDSESI